MKTVQTYVCEKCGLECVSPRVAAHCEAGSTPGPFPVQPGDAVFVKERYDGWQPDRVVSVKIVASYATIGNAWLPDDHEHVASVLKFDNAHRWHVIVKDDHQVSKDADGYSNEFDPGCVRLSPDSMTAIDGSDTFI